MNIRKCFPFRLRYSQYRLFSQMQKSSRSTIFALSTSSGISAVAIIRISGPDAQRVPLQMSNFKSLPDARKAMLRKVRDPQTGQVLDKSLLLWFPAPDSYTGEDMCELHVHGSIAVIKTVLKALAKLPSYRHAEAGEFTKRAFLAGKLDLTEIEGLADLLHAQTEAQQRQALKQMEGHLFKLYSSWTERIKNSLARIEAYIDFSEDQNLEEENIQDMVDKDLRTLQDEMRKHLNDDRQGEKLRNGVMAVLIGQPNVGKSSLMNAICQRDVAIVSHIPGTTRDIVESSINLGGYLVHLYDTAGIRESLDVIELEGVKRACKKLSEADILLFILEAEAVLNAIELSGIQNERILIKQVLHKKLAETISENGLLEANIHTIERLVENGNLLLILNKTDLLTKEDLSKMEEINSSMICPISCISAFGIQKFLKNFSKNVESMFSHRTEEETVVMQERHRTHIEKCLNYLSDYQNNAGGDMAIAAENLRKATYELGKITGKITTDDILDIIFRDFCIGK